MVVATIPVGANPTSVAVAPNNAEVYVANSADNTVTAFADRALAEESAGASVLPMPKGGGAPVLGFGLIGLALIGIGIAGRTLQS